MAVETLLAAALCLAHVGERPFWQDEVASVSVSGRSVAGILDVLADTDANMGLYYLVLHAWMKLGSGEGWVRGLSAVFAAATVPVTVVLARRFLGAAVAVAAGFLLATNVFLVAYGQDARSYALGLFLSALSTLLFVRALDRPARGVLVAYAAVSVLAVYANAFGGLVLVAHLVTLAVLRRGPAHRPLLLAQAAVAAASAPLAVVLLGSGRDQVAWIPAPGPRTLVHFGYELAGSRVLAAVVGGLALAGCVRLVRGGWPGVLVVAWLCVPPLLLFALSFATPIFVSRYLIGCLPALALAAAAGLVWAARASPLWPAAACAVVAVLSLSEWTPNRAAGVEDLRSAALLVARGSRPGDGIAYVPAWTRVGLDYHLERVGSSRPVDLALARRGRPEQVGDLYAREAPAATVARRLARYRRVWVASYPGSTWHPTPEPMLEAGARVLAQRFHVVSERRFGQIRVALYVRG